MTITPVGGDAAIPMNDNTAFDAALTNAQSGEMTPELEEMMIEGAIFVGGQMILMPIANDILKEAMSDE